MKRMTAAVALMGVGLVFSLAPARAETLEVVELFTSQGCSSCPPADKVLAQLVASRPDVVALSYNVDYWDYLGWKDTLGKAEYTARQRAYARARGDGAVYTPQAVVAGEMHVIGSHKGEIEAALAAAAKRSPAVALDLAPIGNGAAVAVSIGAAAQLRRSAATVWLAMVEPRVAVTIKKGENAGRKVVYHNVVRELSRIGMWSGGAVELKVPLTSLASGVKARCAVLVQDGDNGPLLAAAWMPAN